jgi:uncharacterized protein (TIGR01319 family)
MSSVDEVSVAVVTDCGSTTTKAILIERIDGVLRQTHRGEAPTTVEAPVEDVTAGVIASLRELSDASGRRLIDEKGELIRPAREGEGTDLYLSTSSAGGGLQMMVAGMVARISAESAQRAALGAGAIVADVVACDDERPLHEQVERVRRLRPDMVLLAGGTDGGARVGVIEMAELLAAADPRPRFGEGFRLPVVYAGNSDARGEVSAVLGQRAELFVVDNLRPVVDRENLDPAREKIHDLFLDHVMRQAPGFSRLVDWTDSAVMPTPSAVGAMLEVAAERSGRAVLCVDIGGATTDVFSVVDGVYSRTVSANQGVSYSAANVLAATGREAIERWLPFEMEAGTLRDAVMNKTIRPTTIPDTLEDLLVEQALAREALRLSFEQHRAFSTGLKGGRSDRNIDAGLRSGPLDRSRVTPEAIGLIVGSGGVLSHAPRNAQTAAMLVDAFQPTGVTRLTKDSIFMMPHLGVLAGLLREEAALVLERDCLEEIGVCVAPPGRVRQGRPCLSATVERAGGRTVRERLSGGDLYSFPLAGSEEALLVLEPARGVDVGAGRGHRRELRVGGGGCGVVIDCRGRPIAFPEDEAERRGAVARWLGAIGAYRDEEIGA